MTHAWNRPVLRPRTLAVDQFAQALAGDATAEDNLRLLTAYDSVAQSAHEALVVADLERRYREALSSHGLSSMDMGLIDRVLADLATGNDDPCYG